MLEYLSILCVCSVPQQARICVLCLVLARVTFLAFTHYTKIALLTFINKVVPLAALAHYIRTGPDEQQKTFLEI